MAEIFLCYRREDSAGHARGLRERLVKSFGAKQVFFDRDSIGLGEDFTRRIERDLQTSAAMLVLIGRKWLDRDENGNLRLSKPNDHVRLEVAAALGREEMRVIPVLVDGAMLPTRRQLPKVLKPLAGRQTFEIRDQAWNSDVTLLIRRLREILASYRAAAEAGPREKPRVEPAAGRGRTGAERSARVTTSEPGTVRSRAANAVIARNRGLIELLARQAGLTREQATRAILALFGTEGGVIPEALQRGEKVQIAGFGSFEARRREVRKGRNPRTGKEINVEPLTSASFRVGKELKDSLAKG